MITQLTAERIWNAYREIETGKKLLAECEEIDLAKIEIEKRAMIKEMNEACR